MHIVKDAALPGKPIGGTFYSQALTALTALTFSRSYNFLREFYDGF